MATKIDEDLAGAVEHWGDRLKTWIFVYNARRGLPPDIPAMLQEQQERYPDVAFDACERHALGEGARPDPPAAVRDPRPPGRLREHLFLMGGAVGHDAGGLRDGRILIVQDIMGPIDLGAIVEAIRPEVPLGPPVFVRPVLGDWVAAVEYQQQVVSETLAKSRDLRPRFAVFSLAPIPLAAHLGFALSDRVDVAPYQFQRDRRSWTWGAEEVGSSISVSGLPDARVPGTPDLMRVSLSVRIAAEDTAAVVPASAVQIEIAVGEPGVLWLRRPSSSPSLADTSTSPSPDCATWCPGAAASTCSTRDPPAARSSWDRRSIRA